MAMPQDMRCTQEAVAARGPWLFAAALVVGELSNAGRNGLKELERGGQCRALDDLPSWGDTIKLWHSAAQCGRGHQHGRDLSTAACCGNGG